MTSTNVRHGVFTPAGAAICLECHDAIVPRPSWWRKMNAPTTPGEYQVSAPCSLCGALAWQRSDVGRLANLVALCGTGHLEQTGGMCCAARIPVDGGESVIIATVDDEADDDGNDTITAYLYDRENWDDGDREEWTVVTEGASIEDTVAAIKNILEDKQ